MRRDSEKEWYYGNADKERLGPYSFDEVIINFDSSLCIIVLRSQSLTLVLLDFQVSE